MNIIKHPMRNSDASRYGAEEQPLIHLHTLENDRGMRVSISELGATVTEVVAPDRHGKGENVVLGFDDVQDYHVHRDLCLGATIGRVAGRIAHGRFTLNQTDYQLTQNEGDTCLHGGMEFNTALWESEDIMTEDTATVIMSYKSPHGSNGFPGAISTKVFYTLGNDNTFHIRFAAASTEDTILALTNHTYFNLSGNLKDDILNHALKADVTDYVELDKNSIPTGKLIPVDLTPFDFTRGRMLRSGITSSYAQNVLVGNGYDHPLLFRRDGDHTVTLYDGNSGRVLTIKTDFPGFVIYTGNFIGSGYQIGGVPARDHLGVALEMQALPDAVHHEQFPSVLLRAGEMYEHEIVWTFRTDNHG